MQLREISLRKEIALGCPVFVTRLNNPSEEGYRHSIQKGSPFLYNLIVSLFIQIRSN